MVHLLSLIKPLTMKEFSFYGLFASLGSAISYMFGGWTPAMTLLIILMATDYITGILASLKEKKGISSNVSFWGLVRKGLMLVAVIFGHQIDLVMNTEMVKTACIYFWYGNEMISIVENYGRLGLPLPDSIKDKFSNLKDKGTGSNSNNTEK